MRSVKINPAPRPAYEKCLFAWQNKKGGIWVEQWDGEYFVIANEFGPGVSLKNTIKLPISKEDAERLAGCLG